MSNLNYIVNLVHSNGYPIEEHRNIKTKDGYFLTVHRIPHGKNGIGDGKGKRPPVFLLHGMCGSSDHFVFTGPNRSLGYILADKGYDVWLGNSRSVAYCRRHEKYDPDVDKEFWDYSLHELGIYDLPAMIDHVLSVTGYDDLFYVGHSRGTVLFAILCAEFPDYNKKIRLFVGLSPAIYINNLAHPWVPKVIKCIGILESIGIYELPPCRRMIVKCISLFSIIPLFKDICILILFLFGGFNYQQFDKESISAIVQNSPESFGLKQFRHIKQIYDAGKFCKFDYGSSKNLEIYGQENPPTYQLENIKSPVAVYYSKNDWFLPRENAKRLVSELPNVVENYEIPMENFTHTDFIWAKDIVPILYDRIVNLMDKY